MSSADEIDVVVSQELRDYITAEYKADSSLVFAPAGHALLRVRPQQIAEQSLIRNFDWPDNLQDLLEILQLRADAAMHAQNLLINERTDRHHIEHIREGLPQFQIVFSLAYDIRDDVHSSQKPQMRLMLEHSWLPRSRKKFSGCLILQASSKQMHSIDCFPRSTQSPRKRQLVSPGKPPYSNSFSRSENWPWTSPQILIGASSYRSMGWERKISLDFKHNPLISDSRSLQSLPLASRSLLIIVSTSISQFCIWKTIQIQILYAVCPNFENKNSPSLRKYKANLTLPSSHPQQKNYNTLMALLRFCFLFFELAQFILMSCIIVHRYKNNAKSGVRMNRNIDMDSLKMENFQLKNEITDLKNGFDLNRDVLKILSQQISQKHPQSQIFYQIISRLTGINNQLMLNNVQLIQQKNKLAAENKKLQNTVNNLSTRLEELMASRDCTNPKEIHMQMRDQMKELRQEILALNEDLLRRKLQAVRLQGLIKEKEKEEMKKPIIPSVKEADRKINTEATELDSIPKKFESEGKVSKKIAEKNLERENAHLKRLVEQLEYRLTLFSRLYEMEPFQQRETRNEYEISEEPQELRRVTENQLKLLMFALNNTKLEQDGDSDAVKVTITKRCKHLMTPEKTLTRTSSSLL